VRAKEVSEGRDCFQGHVCYEDLAPGMIMFDEGNTSDFGHGAAAGHFKLWTAEDLGANPNGLMSACPISLRTFTSSGFIAIYQARTPYPAPLPPAPPPHPPSPPPPASRITAPPVPPLAQLLRATEPRRPRP